jgi:broad specificity phosphatase PhoE
VAFDYTAWGGEAVTDVVERLLPCLASLEAKHVDGEALVITHGGIIRVLRSLEGQPVSYQTEKNVDLLTFDTSNMPTN